MARGRMVNKKISNSQRVNDLPLGAQLLFTWLIPHLDCNGCFYGSAQMIKSLVVPRKSWPKSLIKKWLALMENSVDFESGQPLLQRYLVGKDEYLFMPGFVDEQIGLRRDKEKPDFPPFDGKNTESVGQTVPLSRTGSRTGSRREVEVREEMRNKLWLILQEGVRDKESYDAMTERLLSLLIEEIKKVENPFNAEGFPLMELSLRLSCNSSFEVARQAFIKRMEEK